MLFALCMRSILDCMWLWLLSTLKNLSVTVLIMELVFIRYWWSSVLNCGDVTFFNVELHLPKNFPFFHTWSHLKSAFRVLQSSKEEKNDITTDIDLNQLSLISSNRLQSQKTNHQSAKNLIKAICCQWSEEPVEQQCALIIQTEICK